MTVRMVDHQRLYVGLSGDVKPEQGAMGEAIPAGMRFIELNTKQEFLWSSTAWYQISTSS